jgi:ribosomal protein L19
MLVFESYIKQYYMSDEASKIPEIKPGMTVKVHQTIKETNAKGEEKQRTQIFEGMVLAKNTAKK